MKTDQELRDLYREEYTERFAKLHSSNVRLGALAHLIELTSTDSVLDLACGNGLLMDFVAPRVSQYTGIDFSEAFIKAAIERRRVFGISNAEFICEDIEEYCQKNHAKFDAAFALDFSEHVYDDQWSEMLKSIRVSLKSGGRLYLHSPNATFFIEKMKSRNFLLRQFPEHIAVRSVEENARLIRSAGYKIRVAEAIPHYDRRLRALHELSRLPVVGKYLGARVFIEAINP